MGTPSSAELGLGPFLGQLLERHGYTAVRRKVTTMMTANPASRDERYQRSLDVHRKIEALYSRIDDYRAYFRGMTPVDPAIPKPPGRTAGVRMDPVACALAIKAATTKRAILALCELGDGDNALALTRVL